MVGFFVLEIRSLICYNIYLEIEKDGEESVKKEIRTEVIDNVLESLVIGKCNSQSLLDMVVMEDAGGDFIKEYTKEIERMERHIKMLKTWRGL